jgi:hypothetical protein
MRPPCAVPLKFFCCQSESRPRSQVIYRYRQERAYSSNEIATKGNGGNLAAAAFNKDVNRLGVGLKDEVRFWDLIIDLIH